MSVAAGSSGRLDSKPHLFFRHHSNRDTQYASTTYRDALTELEIRCSMSRKGNCWDNAVSESFFSTIKHELIHRHDWESPRAASFAIAEYIECFYNTLGAPFQVVGRT